jgi:hypothetical protein
MYFELCISSMPIKSDRHEYPALEQKRSTTTATFRIRFVTLVQGVTKAIGTAFDRRPSGRKVAEPAAIALMTSGIMQGLGLGQAVQTGSHFVTNHPSNYRKVVG